MPSQFPENTTSVADITRAPSLRVSAAGRQAMGEVGHHQGRRSDEWRGESSEVTVAALPANDQPVFSLGRSAPSSLGSQSTIPSFYPTEYWTRVAGLAWKGSVASTGIVGRVFCGSSGNGHHYRSSQQNETHGARTPRPGVSAREVVRQYGAGHEASGERHKLRTHRQDHQVRGKSRGRKVARLLSI